LSVGLSIAIEFEPLLDIEGKPFIAVRPGEFRCVTGLGFRPLEIAGLRVGSRQDVER
jgi:hypothetical protein